MVPAWGAAAAVLAGAAAATAISISLEMVASTVAATVAALKAALNVSSCHPRTQTPFSSRQPPPAVADPPLVRGTAAVVTASSLAPVVWIINFSSSSINNNSRSLPPFYSTTTLSPPFSGIGCVPTAEVAGDDGHRLSTHGPGDRMLRLILARSLSTPALLAISCSNIALYLGAKPFQTLRNSSQAHMS